MDDVFRFARLAVQTCAALVLSATTAQAQMALEGCWLGTMGDAAARRRAIFELAHSTPDFWSGVTHVFTNTVQTHVMSELRVDGREVSFVVSGVEGQPRFSGRLAGGQLRGTFVQRGQKLPVTLERVAGPDAAGLALVDTWAGALEREGTPLMRLVLDVSQVACGQIAATLDSPDQGAENLPITDLTVRGDSLSFALSYLNARFRGRVQADERITGLWTQNEVTMQLRLERAEDPATAVRRPQDPVPPFPYLEQDVIIESVADAARLTGTLTMPRGAGPFAAVALLSGSGAQDRDGTMMGHRPLLVLADHLTRNGFAVLRTDDRGVGGSSGSTVDTTLRERSDDALACVGYLKSLKQIDAGKIGLVGQGEGGWVAPLAATRSADIRFLVLLAGPAVRGEELLIAQGYELNLAAGSSDDFARAASGVARRLYDVLEARSDDEVAAPELLAVARGARGDLLQAASNAADTLLTRQWIDSFEQQTATLTSIWFRDVLAFDPQPTLEQVRIPVLAIYGELDLHVPPKQNVPALKSALAAAGNGDVTVRVLPGLNHLLQSAPTGRMEEYGGIDETIAPVALSTLVEWLVAHTH